MRTGFGLWAVVAAVVLASGGAGGQPPKAKAGKVDFTLTAEELAKAFDADEAAYKAKYVGKRVELTGNVEMVRIRWKGPNDALLAGVPKSKKFFAQYVSVGPRKADQDKYEGLRALAKGQSVTVRGTVEKYGVVVAECEFVKVGPSPALPVTPSGLFAALRTDEGKAKYNDKDVVCRAEVRKGEWNGTVATLTVWDPGVKDGPGLEASLNPQDKELGQELAAIKPGTVVILIGEAQTLNEGRLWDVRVLKEPPEGVTLPEPKK